jgi:hypothetical protein
MRRGETAPCTQGEATAAKEARLAKLTAAAAEDDGDEGEMKVGQANGYGTVAVDLAAEAAKVKETMKALRAAQMDKPPPVAMKLNKVPSYTIHPEHSTDDPACCDNRRLSMRRRRERWKSSTATS